MAIILINNTTSDISLTNTNITIPASGTYSVQGTDKDPLTKSAQFYTLVKQGKIIVNDGNENLSDCLGIGLVRDFRDPPKNLSNFTLDVASGNVPNLETTYVTGYSNTVNNTSYTDIWMATGNISLPSGVESYEIVSSSANDTSAGTGARQVTLVTLDADGLEQSIVINMNGTTPVAIPGTHTFLNVASVTLSGSLRYNEGIITIRVAGGGATRGYILAQRTNSLSAIYKIPSNKEVYPVTLDFHTGGAAKPVNVLVLVMYPGTNTWLVTGFIPFIETSFTTNFKATFSFPPGTIFKYQAKLDTGTVGSVSVILSAYSKTIT